MNRKELIESILKDKQLAHLRLLDKKVSNENFYWPP